MISIIKETESLLQREETLYHYNVQNDQGATHNRKEKQLADSTCVISILTQKASS